MSQFRTRDGAEWMPSYLVSIDSSVCIGCGRCYRVCSREVMHLYGVNDDDKILGQVTEGDDDDFDGELDRKVMVVDNGGACVGCGACARVCPKNSQNHVAANQLAA